MSKSVDLQMYFMSGIVYNKILFGLYDSCGHFSIDTGRFKLGRLRMGQRGLMRFEDKNGEKYIKVLVYISGEDFKCATKSGLILDAFRAAVC